jgi:type I restriction enzyme, S subunit
MIGWLKTTLGNHVDIITGYPFKSELYTESEKSIRLLRGDNIIPGSTRWDGAKYWSLDKVEGLNKYYLNPQDLIIAMDRVLVSNGLKITIIQDEDVPALLVQRVARLRANKGLDQKFLPYLVMSHRFEQYVKSVQTETAIPHISTQQINDFPIVLPPLLEQCRIAEVLGVWDESIDLLERLIGRVRSRKQGLMQQLLTGKKRFKEFDNSSGKSSKEWQLTTLGKCLSQKPKYGANASAIPYSPGAPRYIRITDINEYGDLIDNNLVSLLADKIDDYVLNDNDFLIARSGNTVGKTFLYQKEKHGFAAYAGYLIKFEVNKDILLPSYFKFYTQSNQYWLCIKNSIRSGAQPNINAQEYSKFQILLPPIPEQEKIAAVLSAADEEISTLEKQLAAYKQQKLGLMQQLLTGKIRVGMI